MLFVMLGWTRLWQSSIDFFEPARQLCAPLTQQSQRIYRPASMCFMLEVDLGGDSPEIE
jgi:hypothetical protein